MLSRKTKYALKALSYLAKQEGNVPVQISSISESENISQKFLESILLSLRKAGFLGSKKGKGVATTSWSGPGKHLLPHFIGFWKAPSPWYLV